MASYRIEVTAEDIAEGVAKDCDACPIARAILRCVPGADRPNVGPYTVGWYDGGRVVNASLPHFACAFINAFDRGESVVPFAFTLKMA